MKLAEVEKVRKVSHIFMIEANKQNRFQTCAHKNSHCLNCFPLGTAEQLS